MADTVISQQSGNYLELVADGTWEAGYRTLDDFIEATGADPNEWYIQRAQPKTWPTSGWDDEAGRPWTVLNYRQKITLIRKQPVALHPLIQPVTITSYKRRVPKPGPAHGIRTAAFLTDPHVGFLRPLNGDPLLPFHDRRLLDVFLQVVAYLRPDEVILGGDSLDLPDWSDKFLRSPEMYGTTQPAVREWAWWLAQYRKASPPSRLVLLEGNHDLRMKKALLTHLNQVHELRPADEMHLPPALSLPRLLALHKIDVEWVGGYPDAAVWLNDTLVCQHGETVASAPGGTVGKEVRQGDISLVHGHIHRDERASRQIHGRYGQRTIRAICPGCACHIDGRVPGKKKRQNWQQGFAVIRYTEQRVLDVHTVIVEDGQAYFEGALYRGRDLVQRIEEEIAWKLTG